MTRTRTFTALLIVLALLAAACSASDRAEMAPVSNADIASAGAFSVGGDDAGGVGEAVAEAPADPATFEREDTFGDGGVGVVASLPATNIGRDIIFTAEVTVAVNDVATAGAEAARIVQSVGGLLFGQSTTGGPDPRSVFTFKVLPEDFQEVLAQLGTIGEVRSQTVTADDVTERVVDLESRINTAEASVERLRGFLDAATDIKTIAELENQLLQRETDLETLRGQLRTIQDLVDLATIVMTLTEAESRPAMEVAINGYPGHDDGASCPGGGAIEVEESTEATVCFEIVNVGDTNLQDIEVKDAVLGIDSVDDLVVVFGDPAEVLEPGQSLVLAAELTPERNLRSQTRITATPVLESGETLDGRAVTSTSSIFIAAVDPGGLPGFGDGLAASWELLLTLGGIVVLAAGWLLPFVWLAVLAWLWLRWRKNRDVPVAHAATRPDDGTVDTEPSGQGSEADIESGTASGTEDVTG